jgi:hypothetical protein
MELMLSGGGAGWFFGGGVVFTGYEPEICAEILQTDFVILCVYFLCPG